MFASTYTPCRYLTRLARGPDVVWDRKNNPTPWNNVEPGTQTKLMTVNVSTDEHAKHLQCHKNTGSEVRSCYFRRGTLHCTSWIGFIAPNYVPAWVENPNFSV